MKSEFENMMKQMVSKESLYGPMKSMVKEFPAYLEEHAEKLSPEDLEWYNK